MKVVVAPDSFKECLVAGEVASAIAEGLYSVIPDAEVKRIPLSDGGEGMAGILTESLGGELVPVKVTGPVRETVEARFGRVGKIGILDAASACGLNLVPKEKRNPLITTSVGVGELIAAAIQSGCEELLIGLGGSATCDGGEGMMSVPSLRNITSGVKIKVLCDVNNPFLGPDGSARVFAPQKGADPQMVEMLEKRMELQAERILSQTGVDVSMMHGAGAAGGLGGALHAYLGAELVPGIETVLDVVGFDKEIVDTDLIITGEGTSDLQTLSGKVPMGVLRRSMGIPVYLLSGRVKDRDCLLDAGFAAAIQVTPDDVPISEAIKPDIAKANLRLAATRILSS